MTKPDSQTVTENSVWWGGRSQGQQLGLAFDPAPWRCACGWSGRSSDMVANASDGLCCPKCGGSGGLITEAS